MTLPLIGITCMMKQEGTRRFYKLRGRYCESVRMAGGMPVILPLAIDGQCRDAMSRLDGLILSGGSDIPAAVLGVPPDPRSSYMPISRWESECRWLEAARALSRPVLGICLGMQVINVAAGGSLHQDVGDLPRLVPHSAPKDSCRHAVELLAGSELARWAPDTIPPVVSAHHQALNVIAAGLRVNATAEDGLVEGIESEDGLRVGVQWHPERSPGQPDWVVAGFVKRCGVGPIS